MKKKNIILYLITLFAFGLMIVSVVRVNYKFDFNDVIGWSCGAWLLFVIGFKFCDW